MAGKGQPKTGGRRPGSPNNTTRAVKEAILAAFHDVGAETYLAKVARNDPRTFCALLAKLVPGELRANVGVAISHEEALAQLDWEDGVKR